MWLHLSNRCGANSNLQQYIILFYQLSKLSFIFIARIDKKIILMLPPLGIYIEGEARQATYILNCSGGFT
jgi:hypothetical protein